jgi:ATP-binding cassette subfamily A (ABC1) protein 3
MVFFAPVWFLQQEYGQLKFSTKMASALLINVAQSWGNQVIGMYESDGRYRTRVYKRCSGIALDWTTFAKPATIEDDFSMAYVFFMLLINTLIFMLITWYVEAINPGPQGVPQPPWFPFTVCVHVAQCSFTVIHSRPTGAVAVYGRSR